MSSAAEDVFAEQVEACMDEMSAYLPQLARRFKDAVIIVALADHFGLALNLRCLPDERRRILDRVRALAEGAVHEQE